MAELPGGVPTCKANKVVLCYPFPVEDRRHGYGFPMAVLAVAGPLLASGYDVAIIDEYLSLNPTGELLTALDSAICFGVSAMTGTQLLGALKYSQVVRKHDPKLPIIWGGYHPSIMPEQTISHPLADIVVKGQGEATFLEVVNALRDGRPLDGIQGISYKREGRIIHNPDRPLQPLKNFPPVPYHLIDVDRAVRANDPRVWSAQYLSSQGCPFRCAFCSDALVYRHRWSGRTAEQVVAEVAALARRHSLTHVSFIDANFFVDLDRVRNICRGLIEERLGIQWSAAGRVEQILRFDEELLALVKESGCISIGIGAESGSQEMLDLINKDISVDMLARCAYLLGQARLRSYFSFMIGLPIRRDRRTPKDFWQTILLTKQVKAINPDIKTPVCYYLPYPGSILYQRALELGFREPQTLEAWAGCHWATEVHTGWVTRKEKDFAERCTIFYFPLAYPDWRVKARMREGRSRHFARLLHFLAALRCKWDFYRVPVEWWVAKTLERLPGQKGAFTVSQF